MLAARAVHLLRHIRDIHEAVSCIKRLGEDASLCRAALPYSLFVMAAALTAVCGAPKHISIVIMLNPAFVKNVLNFTRSRRHRILLLCGIDDGASTRVY
jgi:hypothetical protein